MEQQRYSIVRIRIDRETKSLLNMMKFEHGYESMEEMYEHIFWKGIVQVKQMKKNKEVRQQIRKNKT
jgi:hypothetical protein